MKKYLIDKIDKLILFLLSTFNQWHIFLIKKYGNSLIDNPDKYEVLLPKTSTDEKEHYANPLHFALNTPNVFNVAVTGPYGSGKSSFLRTFEQKNAEWNYLPISLATFKDKEDDTESKEKLSDSENSTGENQNSEKASYEQHQDIERSILQQFFYREKDSEVPHSRFKRIRNIKKRCIAMHSIFISLAFLYNFLIYKPEKFKKIFSVNPLEFLDTKYHYVISVFFTAIILYYTYKLFFYFWNIQISKFNFKKGEITLAKQDKASILNEHLDEILYFFEVTNYDVVIFEDLDRFDNTEIFIKLRELNNLINNSKQIGRDVKFIYAIKDDMFIDKDRTKFFDFIIPIIPYINPSNSERKLVDKFAEEIKANRISEGFISQVSLYIEDMRLLLNIYNEYMIYKNNLDIQNNNPLHNKILALIIYKNFYPLEFSKSHNRKGLMHEIFASKDEYIEDSKAEYEEKKRVLEKEVEDIKNERAENIEELRLAYLAKAFVMTNAQLMSIQNSHQNRTTLTQLNSETIFDNIIDEDTQFIGYNRNNYEMGRVKFSEVEKELNSKYSYKERKELIESKFNDKVNKLKEEIESLDKKIREFKHKTLKELFKVETISKFIIDKYQNQYLLIFLVRNGYIDENYEHYISYFHKGGITQEDREFLLSVQNFKKLDFQFKLGSIKKLIEKLEEKNFQQIEILNCDLLIFLLDNKEQYSGKLKEYLKQLSNDSEVSIKFIFEFIDISKIDYQLKFIQELKWSDFWKYIYNTFSSEKQQEYFQLIFKALSAEEIVSLNVDNTLKAYIEKQSLLPLTQNEDTNKYKKLINKMNIKFSNIENPSENIELFDFIYQNNHYIININMIDTIMKTKTNIEVDLLKSSHLTTIKNSEEEELINYIDSEINTYIEEVFLNIEDNTKESEQTLLDLLNNENIIFKNKVEIIQKEDVKISDISSIEDKELWMELIQNNKIKVIWKNLLFYYQETKELNDTIIDFLNIEENYIELSKSKINNEELFDKETTLSDFNRKILLSTEVSDNSYKYLIKSISFWKYQDLEIENLNPLKIDCILKEKKLALSEVNIKRLKENFPPKHIILIENLKDDFLNEFDNSILQLDDILELLNSTIFTIDEKLNIIESTDKTLFENEQKAKEIISKLYIDNSKKLEIELFEKIFYGKNRYSLKLLISQIPHFDNCDICQGYLNEFGKPYNKLLEDKHGAVTLENNELNMLLVTKLSEKECIGKVLSETKNIKAYRKRS